MSPFMPTKDPEFTIQWQDTASCDSDALIKRLKCNKQIRHQLESVIQACNRTQETSVTLDTLIELATDGGATPTLPDSVRPEHISLMIQQLIANVQIELGTASSARTVSLNSQPESLMTLMSQKSSDAEIQDNQLLQAIHTLLRNILLKVCALITTSVPNEQPSEMWDGDEEKLLTMHRVVSPKTMANIIQNLDQPARVKSIRVIANLVQLSHPGVSMKAFWEEMLQMDFGKADFSTFLSAGKHIDDLIRFLKICKKKLKDIPLDNTSQDVFMQELAKNIIEKGLVPYIETELSLLLIVFDRKLAKDERARILSEALDINPDDDDALSSVSSKTKMSKYRLKNILKNGEGTSKAFRCLLHYLSTKKE